MFLLMTWDGSWRSEDPIPLVTPSGLKVHPFHCFSTLSTSHLHVQGLTVTGVTKLTTIVHHYLINILSLIYKFR